MATPVGDLIARLRLDNSGLSRDVRQAEQSMSGLATRGVAMAARLAASWLAAYGTIASVRSITMAAARYETLGIVLEQVGKNAGYTAAQMHEFAKGLQDSGISMTASRQALTRMTQAQLDLTRATRLARVAQDAAVVGNINSSEAFERMVYGIQSAQTVILRTIGLNVSFEQGYQKTAKTLGKTAAQLTETEKAQSRLNEVLEAGERLSGVYEKSMQTVGKQLGSLQRHIENFQVLSGRIFSPTFSEMIKDVTKQITDLNDYLAGPGTRTIEDWGEKFKEAYVKIRDSIAGVNREITNFQKAHPIISEGLSDVGGLLLKAVGYALAFQLALLSMIKSFRLVGVAAGAAFGPIIKLAGLVATAIGGITLAAITAGGAIPLIGTAIGALAVYIVGLKIGEKLSNEWEIAGQSLGEWVQIWYSYFDEFLVKVEYVFNRIGDVIETIMRGVSASIKVIVGEIIAKINEIPGVGKFIPDNIAESANAAANAAKGELAGLAAFAEEQKKASQDARDAELAHIEDVRAAIKTDAQYARDLKKYGPSVMSGAADVAGLAAAEAEALADLSNKLESATGAAAGYNSETSKTVDVIKSVIEQLQFETSLLGESEAVQQAMTLARQAHVKIGSKEYKQILSLVNAHQQEKKALEEREDLMAEGARITESSRTELEIYNDTIIQLDKLLEAGAITQAVYTKEMRRARGEFLGINDLMEEGIRLRESLRTEQEASIDELTRINMLLQAGAIDQETYNRALEKAAETANQTTVIFEEAAKNIYSSFTDTFRDIFDHGLDSFKDLGDRILDVFKDILAQMATLAIARPVIVPVVTAVGSIMGVQNATAGILKEMGISGPAATGSTNITMPGAGITDWAAENIPGLGFLGASMPGQLSVADYEAMSLAAGTDLGISEPLTWGDAFGYGAIASLGYSTLGDALGLPQSPYSGLGAGLGGAAGSWVGATQGAALGSFAPGIGTLIGGILGGVLGGLLGDDDEPKFDLARLVQYFPPEFSPETGFESFDWKHPVVGSSWYWPIADAYSAAINEIQQSFNAMVFDFAEKLPQEMQDQIIGDLAATDFEKLLIDVSAGRWKAHEAEGVLGRIAENYYKNLSDILANTFAGALESFGPEAFFQDIPGWQYLETRVQDNVKSMFTGIADTIRSGGIEKGLQELDIVNTVIANINQAIAPINEIVETSGLTEYELGVRNINKQFDRQAAALKDAGVDLEKFTALEEARIIELNKLADQFLKPILTDINEIIDTAGLSEYELNLRNINKQFDEYAKVLEEVGASQNDLIKLEQARQIQIAELQAKAQAEQAQAQIDQARAQVEQAQANLRSAFQAEIDRLNAEYSVRIGELNESLGETRAIVFDIESYVNKLRSASERLESLFRVGPETERERYGLAIEEMQKVLGQAEKGNLSGLADIDKTLDTLISITPETYANSLDYQRDFYVALKMISDLEDVTTDELSIQEKMLAGIKQQIAALEENHKQEIAYLESQLNSLLGIEQGTLTISEAINQLNAAVSNLAAATQAQATAIQTQAKEYYLEADRFEKLTVEPDSATLYFTSGGSHTVTGPNAEQLLRETYGFAEGGTLIGPTSGYFASAQFHGVEHIIPGTQMEELTSEVKQLRAELKQANFAIAKNAKKTSQVLDRWDYDGIPATRMI